MKKSLSFYLLKFANIRSYQTKAKILLTGITIFCLTLNSIAQTRIITGVVTDDKGVPVEGATIRIKGSKTGTSADINGAYSTPYKVVQPLLSVVLVLRLKKFLLATDQP